MHAFTRTLFQMHVFTHVHAFTHFVFLSLSLIFCCLLKFLCLLFPFFMACMRVHLFSLPFWLSCSKHTYQWIWQYRGACVESFSVGIFSNSPTICVYSISRMSTSWTWAGYNITLNLFYCFAECSNLFLFFVKLFVFCCFCIRPHQSGCVINKCF